MALVEAFSIQGLRLWFWSNDHDPPHFHAKKTGEWEVKVSFLLDEAEMLEVKWQAKKPSERILSKLRAKAREHREALLEEWTAIRQSEESEGNASNE
jgi:hypothetical protein